MSTKALAHRFARWMGAILLSGCGADASGVMDLGDPVICDGSTGVRLAVVVGGGGPVAPGTAMLSENGWQFLLVDGQCTAWILASENGPLRTLTLSREREQGLSAALRLSQWSGLARRPSGAGCPDAPGMSFRFDQLRLSTVECGLPSADPLRAVITGYRIQIDALARAGTELTGDMRYLVLRDPDQSMLAHQAPVRWPLGSVPIDSVALTRDQANLYMRGDSQRATGADASRLRAIRATMLSGSISAGFINDYTLIASAGGDLFLLYARDSGPLEDDRGLLPAEIF